MADVEVSSAKTIEGGVLFAIEGIDGAGKTTQSEILVLRLRKQGFIVASFHEPTDMKWGKKIRELANNGRNVSAEEELRYFIEDRKQDVEKNIQPALDRGEIVIMDRYYLSNIAYQGALGLDPGMILKENVFAPEPDIILILDVAPRIGLTRVHKRENGRPNHFEDPEYLKKVRAQFKTLETSLVNVQVINATRTITQVAENIWNVCDTYLREKMEKAE